MFDWDDIRLFLAVSRTGTVRGAAKQLSLTHATVSRRLHQLEEKLGTTLFDRTSTRHILTEAGQNILETAQEVEAGMARIDRMAFARDSRLAGLVRLSMLDSLYLAIVQPFLGRFQARHPMIEIELITTDYLSNLAQREADIVVRITKTPPDSALGRKLADSPLACYAAEGYLADRPKLDRWIALTHEPARQPILSARTVLTANSLIIARDHIRDGLGIGLLPCFLGDQTEGVTRMPGIDPIPDMEIWALMHPDIKNVPRIRSAMDFLYEIFDEQRVLIEGSAY
ncbi:LysR family transcriptional regulator [Aestuariispira insulae]|uniref:DNA-binding transcriptional LysR family regulator n=1 Tax=Aestuariispira insulae TaxID=1461337 RepID=A0A3D9HVK4_9PROT|nr:LysR family transcriptional regulator [Aestuariispira insulae]RED53470.1 DNA-binding transcriptional LysR family regulator [Aestuariispira insulae]